jgi:hypothetical protein
MFTLQSTTSFKPLLLKGERGLNYVVEVTVNTVARRKTLKTFVPMTSKNLASGPNVGEPKPIFLGLTSQQNSRILQIHSSTHLYYIYDIKLVLWLLLLGGRRGGGDKYGLV